MQILALIPSRSGSKRLKGKNLMKLGKSSLTAWSLNFASELLPKENIFLSTDSSLIAEEAITRGIDVPWLRGESESGDYATSESVALQVIELLENRGRIFDAILLLQPTSPFRSLERVKKGFEIFQSKKFNAVVAVTQKSYSETARDCLESGYYESSKSQRINRSRLGTEYSKIESHSPVPNGNFYFITTSALKIYQTFLPPQTFSLTTESKYEALDIDEISDLMLAKKFYMELSVSKSIYTWDT